MRNDDNKDHYLNSKSQDLFISREYFSCVCDLIIFSLIKMSLERERSHEVFASFVSSVYHSVEIEVVILRR